MAHLDPTEQIAAYSRDLGFKVLLSASHLPSMGVGHYGMVFTLMHVVEYSSCFELAT